MKIIDSFKKQPLTIQILDIVFAICIIYEFILIMFDKQLNGSMSLLMLFIIFVITVHGLGRGFDEQN
ncbi:hypothetical protein [Methanobrevibacter sp.]|uniref:hypothetical protein n=1 Tax=Methanobrevibacter sp. TaxID=66852 RepID=UPI003870059F